MKKLFSVVVLCIVVLSFSHAQPCLQGGITFTTQAQVDNFPINYPNCSEIIGDLKIMGENITHLDSLYPILRVNKSVSIESTALQDLTGLDNLKVIEHGLSLHSNYELEHLAGLNNLDTIGGLSLWANHLIHDLSDLQNLTSCGGISAAWNTNLTSFSGLNNVKTFSSVLDVTYNWSLQNFEGLNNIESASDVFIAWNDSLQNMDGLENLKLIKGDLTIYQNGMLENLDGLSTLDTLKGSLSIGSEYSLTSIAGLDGIAPESIKNLGITNNGELTDCSIQSLCNYLMAPNGRVTINNNGSGCSNPGEIANACNITLPCLPYGNYIFDTQSEIDSFQFHYPNCHNLNGEVLIRGSGIQNLYGLSNVTSVSEKLVIAGNHRLLSLDGLDSLTSVGFDFFIGGLEWPNPFEGNDSLTDLSALANLNNVGYELVIGYNKLLQDLSGLENVDGFWDLLIFDNPSLSNCAIESVCSHLFENGDTQIYNNSIGCDSKEEVKQACLVSVEEGQVLSNIISSPNPFRTDVRIDYNLDPTSVTTLTIFNHLGKQVAYIQQHQQSGKQHISWNAEGLPAGMYFFTLQAGDQVATGKLVKVR